MPAAIHHGGLLVACVAGAVAVFVPVVHAGEADDQYAVAAGHYDSQRWPLAVEEFLKFLQAHPDDPRASSSVFFLGEASLQLGKHREARDYFRKYIERDPNGVHLRAAMFRAAEAAYLASEFDTAKPELEAFRAEYPDDRLNAFVLPYLGDMALTRRDYSAAEAYYRDGLNRFPDGKMQDDCRVGLGRSLEKQAKPEEAESLYAAVAGKADSRVADAAAFYLGAIQFTAGRFGEAEKSFAAFEDRLSASPWQPNARLGRAAALLKQDRPAEAVAVFDAVLATLSLDNAILEQALCGKIRAALQQKDHAAVDRDAAEFAKRFPQSEIGDDVRRMSARSLVERKQYAQAAGLIEPLTASDAAGQADKDPSSLENRYLLAVSYEGLGRPDEALAALRPVVDAATGPLKADAQLTLGSLLLGRKQFAEATAPLEASLKDRPADDATPKALGELAIAYARTGQLDKAKKRYAELVEKYPRHAVVAPTTEHLAEAAYDANDAAWSAELSGRLTAVGDAAEYGVKGKLGVGWSQFKAGKLAEAAATFDELLRQNPPAPIAAEAALARGQILEQLGQHDAALAMFDAVIEKHPDSKQHTNAMLGAIRVRDRLAQYEQSAALCERFVAQHPECPKLDSVLYSWAWALQELNKPGDAEGLFERLRKECPKSLFWADATCRLAQRALDAKDWARANSLVDEALAATTPEPGVRQYALFLRGRVAAAQNDWPKTREAFETLLREFPDTSRRLTAQFWIAEACYRQNDYAAAAPQFEQLAAQIADRREPWMAMIPLRRAQILALQDQWSDAKALAAKISADFPDFAQQYEVDYLLGRCLANSAEFDAAREAYRRVIDSPTGVKTETAAMAQWMIGETFFHQKNYEAAYREYLKVEQLYAFPTWQAAALLQAGKCCELLGKKGEAGKLFQGVVTKYPNTQFAEDAAGRLNSAEKKPAK